MHHPVTHQGLDCAPLHNENPTLNIYFRNQIEIIFFFRLMSCNESCTRPDGLKLEPLKLNLEAYVEIPLITFLNVQKDRFKFEVSIKQSIYNLCPCGICEIVKDTYILTSLLYFAFLYVHFLGQVASSGLIIDSK